MTLDELSALVKRIREYPIEEVQKEMSRLEKLIRYTKHTKKKEKYQKQYIILKEFQEIYDGMKKV